MNFFAELRRRNVYRVATAYIVVGWLIMQVVDVLAPALQMPDWIASLFAVILMIGFPIVLALSWVYDVTPDGVVRTDAVADTGARSSSRRLDIVIVAGLVMVGSLIVWQQLDRRGPVAGGPNDAIAVLPFNDLSPGGTFQYFADGVAEQILNTLMRQSELTVKGRTSSFSFRDSDVTIAELGEKLDVGAVLEGSVRKFEDRVRIDARLVRANDGVMLWTETYESQLGDIFALQDRIAEQVMLSLSDQLAGEPVAVQQSASAQVDAYAAYLQASALIRNRIPADLLEARRLLQQAVELDQSYAPLFAALARAERLLTNAPGGVGLEDPVVSLPRATNYAERALELDPDLPDALAVRGLLYADANELLLAERSLRRALELNPGHTDARLWLALNHFANRRYRDGYNELVQLFSIDP
ncbi:MAG: adenylyl cyclase, partial [Pseudomonadota bacterium]